MNNLRSLPLCVLASAFFCSAAALAQQAAPRITTQVDETSLTTLKGNVPMIAQAQYDQGEAPASMQLTGVRLVLSRSADQEAALDQYLAELQDKSSPNYHKWLTPQQFGALYGPADSDIAAIVAWLQSQGLTVTAIPPGRTNIPLSGSVSQLEDAFHVSIHSFVVNGRQFYSNTSDPQIPSALAGVVMGVAHLNTIKPRPLYARGPAGKVNSDTKRLEPLSSAATVAHPNLTGGSGTTSDPYTLYIVPGDAATIYDTPNSTFNANFSSGASYTGSGVTIGIGGDAVIQSSIVQAYRSTFLGSSTAPTITNVNGVTSTADSDEAYIDTELAGAMAPAATIHFYTDSDDLGIDQMLTDNSVDIFSLSFGACELEMDTADNAQFNAWWQQAATQGIAVLVATGDNGSADCDNPNSVTVASDGLAVSGFASTPYNLAVGGTDFYPLLNSYSTYASTLEGTSSTYYRTAEKYIPESTWNDSTYNNTTVSANVPWTAAGYPSNANIVAGSGGKSSCSTNTTTYNGNNVITGSCTSGYAKPTWQRGTGVPSDGVRDLPDISLLAGNGYDNAAWLACDNEQENDSGVIVTSNCEQQSNGNSYFGAYGGTSASVQAFAGILALVQQKTGGRLGQAAKELYDLYNGSNAGVTFHDVMVGNNSVPCNSGTPNCTSNSGGYYFESGYDTTTGYDLATGLGSVDVTQLVNYWGMGTGNTAATIAVTPTTPSLRSGDSLTETVSVTGSSSTPTGVITLTSGSYSSNQTIGTSPCTSNTNCVFTIPGGSLAAGTDTLTATYSGDATYASGYKTATATVTQSTYALNASTPSSVSPGGSTASTVTVTTNNNYAGTITLTCAVTSGPSTSYEPTCSAGSTVIMTSTSGSTQTGTATLTIYTTAASAELVYPKSAGRGRGWLGAGSGTVLALLFFFGIPARRRNWRSMLCILVALTTLSLMTSCGGGGSSGGGGGTSTPATTAGSYIFTVNGTGNDSASTKESTTFTLTVN